MRFKIPDVLANENVRVHGQCHCVFQMPANGQRDSRTSVDEHRQRRIAASPPEDLLPAKDNPNDRVIRVALDPAIVNEEHIGDCSKTPAGIMFIYSNRLVCLIAARRNHRATGFAQQNVV